METAINQGPRVLGLSRTAIVDKRRNFYVICMRVSSDRCPCRLLAFAALCGDLIHVSDQGYLVIDHRSL